MTCKIFFAGDYAICKENKFPQILSEELKKVVKEHDIACVNFEAPIIEKDFQKQPKVGPNIFNNKETANKLVEDGFNLFCLSNNHIFDYGKRGIENTIKFLEEKKVDYIGASVNNRNMYMPIIKNINDTKVCIINLAENGFGAAIDEEYGYAYMFEKNIHGIIEENKRKCDFVIIVCHAGAEHWEVPLPEIRETYKEFIDWGADVIIGHHPHVPQGWEKYKEGMIFYSLGNFAFDIGTGLKENNTYCVSLKLEKNKQIDFEILPTIYNGKIVEIDKNKENEKLIYTRKELLEDEKDYQNRVETKCLDDYEKIYKNLYYMVLCIYKGGLKQKAKQIIKRYVLRQKFQDKFLYHNLNIETHYWICKRATRLKMKEKNIH